MSNRPVHLVTIDQSFFVEALTSASNPAKYLDYFPDNVYNVSPNSRLAKILQVLIGQTGVGFLKRNYLEWLLYYYKNQKIKIILLFNYIFI